MGDPGLQFYPRLSPDERTLVVDAVDADTSAFHVWMYPLDSGAPARFTLIPSLRPVYVDGSRILFEGWDTALYVKSIGGGENETVVLESANLPNGMRLPCDCSRNGRFLIYSEAAPKTGYDLWMLPLTGKQHPFPSCALNPTNGVERSLRTATGSLMLPMSQAGVRFTCRRFPMRD